MSTNHPSAAKGYAKKAETYDRGRPDYPVDVDQWLCGDLGLGPSRADLDLCTGTENFTRRLLATDIGVVCVDSGYELHVGGNGGVKVRVTDLLRKVYMEQEILDYTGAFIRLYREEARYLERTALWIERVGLAHVKERIIDDTDERIALLERFKHSQKFAQKDP